MLCSKFLVRVKTWQDFWRKLFFSGVLFLPASCKHFLVIEFYYDDYGPGMTSASFCLITGPLHYVFQLINLCVAIFSFIRNRILLDESHLFLSPSLFLDYFVFSTITIAFHTRSLCVRVVWVHIFHVINKCY